jgi:heme exporter protein B
MAAHTRAREVMLPVLLFPVIVPILIGVVQATGLVMGSAGARDMPWLSLLAAFAVMYVAAGAVVFEYVLEE